TEAIYCQQGSDWQCVVHYDAEASTRQ
ncbi:DUF3343 domain-containing protein, partial [Escherichia coli]|nr:DUF3343 domain-containing protein [Escherichia coli]HBA5786878.1 DUF3343 domain-containing protein [Escherichia coli]